MDMQTRCRSILIKRPYFKLRLVGAEVLAAAAKVARAVVLADVPQAVEH
jgi:hypothetical protein